MNLTDFVPLINKQTLQKRIKELAFQIDKQYKNEHIVLVCVLKGAVLFFSKLIEYVKSKNVEIDFIQVKSYEGINTTGNVKVIKDINVDITNKHLILVEDIIDTGITANFLYNYFLRYNPKSIEMYSLLQKPKKLKENLKMPAKVGFEIGDKFIIGFGLDLDEKYRTLDEILVLKEN